jgi:ribosome-binding protein aMBF1 (putative translation factor)
MEDMKFYTEEEALERSLGPKGTPARNRFDADMDAFLVGEAIRQTREKRSLSQAELGKLMGVQRAQISKIESGKSISFSTIVRAFKAMGVKSAKLDLGALGRVALW